MICKFFNLSHIYKRSSFPNLKNKLMSTNLMLSIVVLEKTLESPLDSKEIKPVNPEGNKP